MLVDPHVFAEVAAPREALPTSPRLAPRGSPVPAPIRAINAVGRAASRAFPPARLSVAALLADAERCTGLADFGGADDFRTALGVWLDGAERDGDLSTLGRFILRDEILRLLENRLRLREALSRSPEILDEPIRRPIFVVGLPGSGTTLVHRLLALDPRSRAPLAWELAAPSPRDEAPDGGRRPARWRLRAAQAIWPDFRAIYPLEADEPEECAPALQQTFTVVQCDARARSRGYVPWLFGRDLAPSYRHHRTVLQLLQRARPGRQWVLSAPAHLFALDVIPRVFPDAWIVHVHRDPCAAAAVGAGLLERDRSLCAHWVDRARLGPEWVDTWGAATDRALAARASAAPRRVCDVQHRELCEDPIGAVRRIRAHFSDAPGPVAEEAMRRWLEANPSDHRQSQSLAAFGASADAVRERFDAYVRRFGVEPEAT